MATRAKIHIAKREEGVSFSEIPKKVIVSIYSHWDGYPEGLGLDIAMSIVNADQINGWEIESLDAKHGDLEYIYYVWQNQENPGPWISIFNVGYEEGPCECCTYRHNYEKNNHCIFVGRPKDLITKFGSQKDDSYYKQNTNYDG